jgi:endonuclease YncB( thermonuclease family)
MMIRKGLAWHRQEKRMDEVTAKELTHAQRLAKQEKLGIWGLKKKPIPPWEFRAKKKAAAATQGRKTIE